jgi:hypothetical protein
MAAKERERSKLPEDAAAVERKVASALPNSAPHFDLSSFTLEQCVLETRFPQALTLWDNAGALWRAIQEKWPEIHLVAAEPAKTSFQDGKAGFVVELKAARIIVLDSAKSMEELAKMGRDFFKLTALHLQLSLYDRLGLRLIYFKEFKDREEAASAFRSLGLIKEPTTKKFDIDERPVSQQYTLRWESEKKGTLVTCKAETRKIDWDPPIESAQVFSPIHKERSGIVLDIDYYTIAPVEIGQVDMGEWLNHALHLVSRDTRYLFEA